MPNGKHGRLEGIFLDSNVFDEKNPKIPFLTLESLLH